MAVYLQTLFLWLIAVSLASSAMASVEEVALPAGLIIIDAPRPEYPQEARRDRITGSGVALMAIDPKSGLVREAKMSKSTGSPILDNAALSAFRGWRFKPGTSVAVVKLPVSFTLAESGSTDKVQARGFGNVPDAAIQELLAGTSPTGKSLSAREMKTLIIHAPKPQANLRIVGYMDLRIGVFLLSVGSDGTVGKVEILQSTGAALADNEVKSTFKKWRFRPNSVKEVRVPMYYNRG